MRQETFDSLPSSLCFSLPLGYGNPFTQLSIVKIWESNLGPLFSLFPASRSQIWSAFPPWSLSCSRLSDCPVLLSLGNSFPSGLISCSLHCDHYGMEWPYVLVNYKSALAAAPWLSASGDFQHISSTLQHPSDGLLWLSSLLSATALPTVPLLRP